MLSRTSARTKTRLAVAAIALAAVGGVVLNTASAVAAVVTPAERSAAAAPQRDVDADASLYVAMARAVKQSAAGKVDTAVLDTQIANLDASPGLPETSVAALTRLVRTSTGEVAQKVADVNAAAAAAAAAQAAAEAAAAQALAATNTPDGARASARTMMAARYGWGDGQFSCLDSLWTKESNWNYQAYNADGGATGIPQALPGSKMASAGSDWATNAATQVAWGLDYISRAYGTPCAAWGHSQAMNWY
ncbi:phospholipase [Microbacterium sp. CJ88]|uniref:aggregation-promoting factor C-terminal-like domain-containing protein n=1 Tax=Microbacterium sp. CJ88 TaxID=3445672 RepID=UPI003F65C59C